MDLRHDWVVLLYFLVAALWGVSVATIETGRPFKWSDDTVTNTTSTSTVSTTITGSRELPTWFYVLNIGGLGASGVFLLIRTFKCREFCIKLDRVSSWVLMDILHCAIQLPLSIILWGYTSDYSYHSSDEFKDINFIQYLYLCIILITAIPMGLLIMHQFKIFLFGRADIDDNLLSIKQSTWLILLREMDLFSDLFFIATYEGALSEYIRPIAGFFFVFSLSSYYLTWKQNKDRIEELQFRHVGVAGNFNESYNDIEKGYSRALRQRDKANGTALDFLARKKKKRKERARRQGESLGGISLASRSATEDRESKGAPPDDAPGAVGVSTSLSKQGLLEEESKVELQNLQALTGVPINEYGQPINPGDSSSDSETENPMTEEAMQDAKNMISDHRILEEVKKKAHRYNLVSMIPLVSLFLPVSIEPQFGKILVNILQNGRSTFLVLEDLPQIVITSVALAAGDKNEVSIISFATSACAVTYIIMSSVRHWIHTGSFYKDPLVGVRVLNGSKMVLLHPSVSDHDAFAGDQLSDKAQALVVNISREQYVLDEIAARNRL